jgi:drug/metabolite transporter (DMT)-like permease
VPLPENEAIAEESPEPKGVQKNYMFANFLSFCCTICFGVGNYLNAIVSAKYGVKAVFMMFPGLFILWVIYHTFTMCRLKKGFKEYLADSEYRNKQTNAIEMWRIRTPIIRCIIQASIQVILAICFFFGGKAQINGGIIASIFASGVIFVAIIFYFKFG